MYSNSQVFTSPARQVQDSKSLCPSATGDKGRGLLKAAKRQPALLCSLFARFLIITGNFGVSLSESRQRLVGISEVCPKKIYLEIYVQVQVKFTIKLCNYFKVFKNYLRFSELDVINSQ